MSVNCYKCHNEIIELEAQQKIIKGEECPHCKTSLKCCKMCFFYSTNSYNECSEPVADRIVEKEKANFCDYFQLAAGNDNQDKTAELKAAADKLFKF